MQNIFRVVICGMIICFGIGGYAHPGRTNSDGCHTNRKTGQYHCHAQKKPTVKPTKNSTETVKKPVLPKTGATETVKKPVLPKKGA